MLPISGFSGEASGVCSENVLTCYPNCFRSIFRSELQSQTIMITISVINIIIQFKNDFKASNVSGQKFVYASDWGGSRVGGRHETYTTKLNSFIFRTYPLYTKQ